MTMVRPTSYAAWASGVSGYVTEPIAADKAQGFLPTGIARSSYMNWLLNAAGQWHGYLDERLDAVIGATLMLKGVVAGFTAGAGASVAPGAMFVSATGMGATSSPSPVMARGVVMQEMLPLAMANVSAGGSLIAGMGMIGASLSSAGNYSLRIQNPVPAPARAIIVGNTTPTIGQLTGAMSTTQLLFIATRNHTGAVTNLDFNVAVYGI